jgi:hypothetical protein
MPRTRVQVTAARAAQVLTEHCCSVQVLPGDVLLVGFRGVNHVIRIGEPEIVDEEELWILSWRGRRGQARTLDDVINLVGCDRVYRR